MGTWPKPETVRGILVIVQVVHVTAAKDTDIAPIAVPYAEVVEVGDTMLRPVQITK